MFTKKTLKALLISTIVITVIVAISSLAYDVGSKSVSEKKEHTGFVNYQVISKDGTVISYQSLGQGPGVIVIPGALSLAEDYSDFATVLSKNFTVNIIERRGRGLSGPQGNNYGLARELEDIDAVLAQTQSTYLFGHSFGGLIALEAARNNDNIAKVAVYEPGVSIDDSISISWVEPAQADLAGDRRLDALVEFVKGTSAESAKMPNWMLRFILPLVIKMDEREQMYNLMPTAIREHEEIARLNNSYDNYRQITAGTLLMNGGKSAKVPPGSAIETLAQVIPHVETAELAGLDHFGPNKTGPEQVAIRVQTFYLGK